MYNLAKSEILCIEQKERYVCCWFAYTYRLSRKLSSIVHGRQWNLAVWHCYRKHWQEYRPSLLADLLDPLDSSMPSVSPEINVFNLGEILTSALIQPNVDNLHGNTVKIKRKHFLLVPIVLSSEEMFLAFFCFFFLKTD